MAHRFHIPSLPDSGRVALPAGVARHLDVLGLGAGDEVVLFDGSGREARVRITSVLKGAAEAEIVGAAERDPDSIGTVAVTLATAVPKGRRMDTLVRMCAELGVARIVPVIARRSVVKLPLAPRPDGTRGSQEGNDRSGKLARWRKICLAASEQSGRNRLTEIAAAEDFAAVLKRVGEFDLAVLLSPDDAAPALSDLLASRGDAKTILLLLGPEGGFTDDELALAASSGAQPARLTRSILRIETACVVAAATAVMTLGR